MRLEKWIPAFAGMTANGVFGPSMSFLCKQESRNCETIAEKKDTNYDTIIGGI